MLVILTFVDAWLVKQRLDQSINQPIDRSIVVGQVVGVIECCYWGEGVLWVRGEGCESICDDWLWLDRG